MSDQIIEPNISVGTSSEIEGYSGGNIPDMQNEERPSLVPGFKKVCFRLGLFMTVLFLSRAVLSVFLSFLYPAIGYDDFSPFIQELISLVFSVTFLYAVPMISAAFLLERPLKNSPNRVYGKPKYFGRAMAMFPAGYGLAISVRLLSLWITTLIVSGSGGEPSHIVSDSMMVTDMPTALLKFFQLAVIAPVLEELLLRGMVMEKLRPYGNGFAIFLSALLFGLMHANFEQFFYAAALGVFLGYIAISTRSIITTTIMHAMFNSISGVLMLISTDQSVRDYILSGVEEDAEMTTGVIMYLAWTGFMLLLLAVGVIMFIYKLIKIKRYRVPKVQTEISAARRWGIFFSTVTVIIMFVLAADTFTFNLIPNTLYLLIADPSKIPLYYKMVFGGK